MDELQPQQGPQCCLASLVLSFGTLRLIAYSKPSPISLRSLLCPPALHSNLASNFPKGTEAVLRELPCFPSPECSDPHPLLSWKDFTFCSPTGNPCRLSSSLPNLCLVRTFSSLILPPLLYLHLIPFQCMLHNSWGTIFLGDGVRAGQVSVSTGLILSAHKQTCFPLSSLKTKQNKTSPDPASQLSP